MAPRRPPLDQAQIIAWYTAGWSLQRIARHLGVHKQDISVVLEQAGVARRPRGGGQSVDVALLCQLYTDTTWSTQDLATILGVSLATVKRTLQRVGVPRRHGGVRRDRPALDPDQRAELQRAIKLYGAPKVHQIFQDRDPSIRSVQMLYGLARQVPKSRGTPRKVDDAAVRAAYTAGTPIAALATQWQCTPRTIWRSLQRTCTTMALNDPASEPCEPQVTLIDTIID